LFSKPLAGAEVGAVEALDLGGDMAGVPGLDDGVAGRDSAIVDGFVVA
jgi:hypothetical protein